ncbi:lactoylglutathione lyase [Spirochaetia bacterium]|nr:lactoylglutathione lyase [Spirochaetia bacterium]GHU33712.1 lactoylglutathione lyase [Spirochaetia bacterium]
MVTRIGHCAIRARDIESTARFYTEVLGMKEAFRMQNPAGDALGSVHIYVAPSQFIEIFPGGTETISIEKTTIGHAHMCYEVDDAAAYLEEVRSRGAPIDTELKRGYSKCIQFWTHDPDGNAIEFMELPPDCLQIAANKRIAAENAGKNP